MNVQTLPKLVVFLALSLFAVSASADTVVYVITGSPTSLGGRFGTVNVTTGAFTQIGPDMPVAGTGLAQGPNGSLLTLGINGSLISINPSTGVSTTIGPTLADCSTPATPTSCGGNSGNILGSTSGTIYATDFDNNLYKVDPSTGVATKIGLTGMPALPAAPTTMNPDGTVNIYDETLFGANGNVYATFDFFTVDFDTMATTFLVDPDLWQIDPTTGKATLIAPIDPFLGAITNVNGTTYAFNDSTGQLFTLNLANGQTTFVSDFDPAAGIITGAAATPEPASFMLTALGMAGVVLSKLKSRRIRNL